MCGIAGFLRTPQTPNRDAHREWLEQMGKAIVHRGPDAGAVYQDEQVALAHRRLSILDLSEAGNQPMVSDSGRYLIVFNGEIYNFPSIKTELEADGCTFRTGTDTEVLLNLFERRGEKCLDSLNGMFAFAIWDRKSKALFLARDRLGKKPLYYYEADGQFAFASEIKALSALPFMKMEVRADAIKDFFAYQYIPDPKTIYHNVHKLAPGHWIRTDGWRFETGQYWDVSFSTHHGCSEKQIEEGLYELIDDAVRLRMISDVPLGAFLSGGVDSSAIVGLMAGQSSKPVTTCSIGFDSEKFDEVHFARQVAEQFETDHHEFTVKDNVASGLHAIARYFDEPFADPSFVPTYYVSQLARKQVTVALAGDGGDENFAGYSKYRTDSIENRLRKQVPRFIRRSMFPRIAQLANRLSHPYGRKAGSLLNTLALEPDTAFFVTNSFFRQSVWDHLVSGDFRRDTHDYDPAEITRQHYNNAEADDHLSRILYTDIKTYLPGDILVKVDRMSMANSLETRAPLLDYRVVEYAASIPSALKLRGKEKKYVLKKTFENLLSDDILYRKKMGFSVPLAHWLRTELRQTSEQVFGDRNGGLSQYFDMNRVWELWQSHQRGNSQNTQELWSLLSFELWWQNYGNFSGEKA